MLSASGPIQKVCGGGVVPSAKGGGTFHESGVATTLNYSVRTYMFVLVLIGYDMGYLAVASQTVVPSTLFPKPCSPPFYTTFDSNSYISR